MRNKLIYKEIKYEYMINKRWTKENINKKKRVWNIYSGDISEKMTNHEVKRFIKEWRSKQRIVKKRKIQKQR